jgi:light-regulated signal transduction histidine kinase (bacteriophytochrome)
VAVADIEIHQPDRVVPLEVWASPVRDHAGRVVLAVAAFSDITERRRAQADIDRLNADLSVRVAQLQVLNRELEAFSYSVSHDLRAPLRSIDGFSKVLLEDYAPQLDATAQDSLRRIRAATQRMGELIDGMLTLARVSRAELKREVVDLSAFARAIVDQLRRAEPDRQVDVVVADGLVAEGDGRLLRAVLENLLGNAWKFSRHRPHARIEVGVQSDGDGGRAYYVRDDGAGFDMAYVEKLFGVFQRLHGMTEFEGTGIGLATVQRIVHRHSGRVWAEGALDRGATFYFTLSSD